MALVEHRVIVVDGSGDVVPNGAVEVRDPLDNSLLVLASDASGTSLANPFNADADGIGVFFAPPGDYEITAGAGPSAVTVPVVHAPFPRGRPYVFLWMGQSNARSNVNSTGGDMSVTNNVFVWDGDETQVGTQYTHPVVGEYPLDTTGDGGVTYANNMGYAAARRLSEQLGRPVYMIMYAKGEHPIEAFIKPATRTANSWTLDTGVHTDMTAFMYPGIANAMAEIPGSPTTIDAFGWMQGESNKTDTAADYHDKFVTGLLGDLVADGLIDDEQTAIAVGGLLDAPALNPWRLYHREAIMQAALTYPRVTYIPADKLQIGDGQHFTGQGLAFMGESIAAASSNPLIEMQGFEIDGTFTPAVADASSGGNEAAVGSASGYYLLKRRMTKDEGTMRPLGIGGWCMATLRITNIDTTGLTSGNAVHITGLPYAARNGSSSAVWAVVECEGVTFGDYCTVRTVAGDTYLKMRRNTSGAVDADLQVSDLNSGSADLSLTITYPILVGSYSDGSA
jgi:hypothetical protein